MLFRLFLCTCVWLCCFVSPQSLAQSEKPENHYADASDIIFSLEKADESYQLKSKAVLTASAELGFLYLTGNTRSSDVKTGIDLRFEQGLWSSALNANLLVKKSDVNNEVTPNEINTSFETTEQKWKIVAKTSYFINSLTQNYIYGNVSYEDNRFSGFDSQYSISSGWGRRWFETKNYSFDADIGPGFKRDVIREFSPIENEKSIKNSQDSIILQAQITFISRINEHIEFKQLGAIKHAIESGQNSVYNAESSITSRLIDSLQLKVSFIVDYNSKVEDENNNLTTETSILLVYSF
jgi:putative salt-induced outer membrane protein YdiY